MPKYNSLDTIPAKVFFEILKNKDYNKLKPKSKEKYADLEAVFKELYDAFFEQMDNAESKMYMDVATQLGYMQYKINVLKQSLHFYFYNKTTKKMRLDFIKALKDGYRIIIDENKPFIDEVQRVLTREIEGLKNDLSLLQIRYDDMIKHSQSKDFNFFESLGLLGQGLEGNNLVREDLSLAMYVSLSKLLDEKIKNSKKM